MTDRAMIELAAQSGADFVAMHNLGLPADKKRTLPAGQDPTAAVERWLEERLVEWERAGLDLARIVFDPGIGFGKNALQSCTTSRRTPPRIAASRTSTLGICAPALACAGLLCSNSALPSHGSSTSRMRL